jgi:putative heme iron utilization protein
MTTDSKLKTQNSKLEAIRAAIQKNPRQMTLMLARELNVPEAEVIRALPETQVRELDINRWEELIRAFEPLDKVHVICSNGAVTLEAFGKFSDFSKTGPFFNVQNATLDMHIRHQQLGSAFAVEKPGHMDGQTTISFQFFDKEGNSAFKVFLSFGGSAPSAERRAQFENIRNQFGKEPVKS